MIYNWLLIRHVLYISMIYLSLLIHILIAIRFHKNKGNRKKTSPPHFSFQIPFIYRAFHEGGVWQRGHSTPHLTPPFFNSASILFQNTLLPEIWWRREYEGKVTYWVRCWVRCLENTSLSETLVNIGVSDKKVRWWGLFGNSLKNRTLKHEGALIGWWGIVYNCLYFKGIKMTIKAVALCSLRL